jgi:hypothetical protein
MAKRIVTSVQPGLRVFKAYGDSPGYSHVAQFRIQSTSKGHQPQIHIQASMRTGVAGTDPDLAKRVMYFGLGLTPDQARELALMICPDLAPVPAPDFEADLASLYREAAPYSENVNRSTAKS